MDQKEPTKKESTKAGIIVLVLILLLGYGCNELLCNNEAPEPEPKKSFNDQLDDLKGEAYYSSQDFLNKRLKSPASAQYQDYFENPEISKYIGDSTFVINAYVDSQNSYGAMLRSNYTAKLKLTNDNRWELLDIKLLEK